MDNINLNSQNIPIIKKIVALAVFFLVIIGAYFYYDKNKEDFKKQPENSQKTESQNPATETKPTSSAPTTTAAQKPKTTTPTPSSPTPSNLTYSQAVSQYGDKRIQFDPNCQVIPNNIIFKNNTKVMFDNRWDKQRTFALDGKTYSLAPYGFTIVTLSSKTLPHTIKIDCGSGRNNGQITLVL